MKALLLVVLLLIGGISLGCGPEKPISPIGPGTTAPVK